MKEEDLKTNDALKSLYDGVQLTEASLLKCFKEYKIEKDNPLNEKFNPNLHEAMFQVDSDKVFFLNRNMMFLLFLHYAVI